jgi:hypothetical protein
MARRQVFTHFPVATEWGTLQLPPGPTRHLLQIISIPVAVAHLRRVSAARLAHERAELQTVDA